MIILLGQLRTLGGRTTPLRPPTGMMMLGMLLVKRPSMLNIGMRQSVSSLSRHMPAS